MKTDPGVTSTDPSNSDSEKKPASPLRRAGMIGLDLVLPISDVRTIYQKGILPTVERFQLIRDMLRRNPTEPVELSWEEAVACAGKPVEQLRTTFKRIRAAWWLLLVVPGALSIVLLLMVLFSLFNLPSGTLLRAGIAVLILAALSGVGFAKALVASYRIWQLETHRVSEAEQGTFRDFVAETRWCRQVFTLGLAK